MAVAILFLVMCVSDGTWVVSANFGGSFRPDFFKSPLVTDNR